MHDFNLHVHSCKHNFLRDTQAIAFFSDPDDTWATKGKIYWLNNAPAEEQVKWFIQVTGILSRLQQRET
eukprot:13831236-Ditylum_brightwellii.AAC.1